MQRGFNYSQDGPGNRLVYHLQGCNLSCPWCSNPEGIPINGCLMQTGAVPSDTVCPSGAIRNGLPDRKKCAVCAKRPCLTVFDSKLKWSCRTVSEAELLDEAERSRLMFFDGGGVTFTGGEATLQFQPLKSVLAALKKRGIHTALETNGTHPALSELFDTVDWLIMDFKHYDSQLHQQITGFSNQTVKENIRLAAVRRSQLLVRIPLINGFNASAEDAHFFASFLNTCGITEAELLLYHEYGKDKWQQCGQPYQVKNGFVSDGQLFSFQAVLKEHGISCIHT